MACGMFSIDFANSDNLYTVVNNSINMGSITAGRTAYGISSDIIFARNVVSIGEVTASPPSSTFWQSSTDVDLFYAMDGKCVECRKDPTVFVHNANTGFYEVVESGKRVHDLLNAEVEKQNYGMFWTEELELVDYYVEPSPSPPPLPSPSPSPSPSLSSAPSFLSTPSSQSGGLSGGNKHGVSLCLISVVVALAAHVAMAQ